MSADSNRRILVVDDNPSIHEDFRKILGSSAGPASGAATMRDARAAFFGAAPAPVPDAPVYEIDSANLGQEAREKVERATNEKRPYALAFVDVRMPPGWDGVETVARLWEVDPDLQVVICTAYSDYSWPEMVRKLGRTDRLLLLKKPFDPVEVCQLATALTEKWNTTARERVRIAQVERAEAEARAYVASLSTMNRALEAARASAEAGARAKSEFLANTSHEIRTPMIAILGSAELLRDGSLDPAARIESLDTIHSSGRHLLAILDDILDLACLETGSLRVEIGPCSPRAIVAESVELQRERASAKGISIAADFADAVPSSIRSDPARLRQILRHLVGNAVQYTEEGGVRVVASVEGAEAGGLPRLAVSVVDTGVGITPEARTRLFEVFSQGDGSLTRVHGGAGLGLALARRLAQLLGGEIEFESAPGAGSTFTLRIPIAGPVEAPDTPPPAPFPASAPARPTRPAAALSGRVLLVEDAPVTRRLHAELLRRSGAEVSTAENGRIACELVRASVDERRPFDLVLMDIQMPVMDGLDATRSLRDAGWLGPIVAVTAHVTDEDREKCLAAGCDDYMTKPVERDAFLELCRALLARSSPPSALPSTIAHSDSEPSTSTPRTDSISRER